MNIVLDTSVVIAVITDESHKPKLIDTTRGASLIAPSSLYLEIGNAFSAMFKRNRITVEEALDAVEACNRIPIKMHPPDLKIALKIAHELGIYAYDAYFIECAHTHRCPLLTLDENLRKAAGRYGIKTIGV